MNFNQNFSLLNFNSFQINATSEFFTSISSKNEIEDVLDFTRTKNKNLFVLGGGSNILICKNIAGLTMQMAILGKKVINETENEVLVEVGAGENWHSFVLWTVENNWGGAENLSLIPGTCGAAPMQNIGAYGIEICQFFDSLEGYDVQNNCFRTIKNEDCNFGYRSSVFKTTLKNNFIITSVRFRLQKNPKLNVSYGAITQELEKMNATSFGVKEISKAVCAIRSSKLPDPKVIGNAGSFFKNPVVTTAFADTLKNKFQDIPLFNFGEDKKISAAWLIEQCGWKAKVIGNTGTYKYHSLVLVNHGNASGNEIYRLSEDIKKSVLDMFGVELETEVNLI